MARYRLKLTSLKFISPVDDPAQETALAVLMKRNGGLVPSVKAHAKVVKLADELGLVFCWAFTTKANGEDYFDLHGDNITEDTLIEVAAEFMAGGGLTDEMHDRDPDGKVVFCMPLTAEVAKAFGVETKTNGLMIAFKPSAEVFAKYKSGEYVGVSMDGAGFREEVIDKSKRVQKHALYTDIVDGHQHVICVYDNGEMYVQYATSEGADNGHSHGIVRGADGSLEILLDSGHTHTLAADQPQLVIVAPDAVVVVQASTTPTKNAPARTEPANKSTPPTASQKVELMKPIVLSEAQFAHYSKLSGADAEAFIAKTSTERDADVQKSIDADPVVIEFSGQKFRASAGAAVIELAKQAKAQAELIAKQLEDIEKTEVRAVAKSTMGHSQGADEIHDYIVKSIRKGGGTKETIDTAIASLKASDSLWESKKRAPGAGGDPLPEDDSPRGEFNALVAKHVEVNKCSERDARVAVLETQKGRELYAQFRTQPSA